MSLIFAAGFLYGINSAANSTPMKLGAMQDTAFDFSFSMKELRAGNQFPIDIRRGNGKITGKTKLASINGKMLNSLFFDQSASTGLLLQATNEVGTITAGAVTVANGATFDTDLGVVYADSGKPLTKVASAPQVGEYSLGANGAYAFNVSENGVKVLHDYLYTSATGGTQIALNNQIIGVTPTFMGVFTAKIGNKTAATLKLNVCTSSKLALATKAEDYAIPEFDFEVMQDASGSIGTLSVAD